MTPELSHALAELVSTVSWVIGLVVVLFVLRYFV